MKATSRVFLVILRLVIGWHFLVEGLYKFETPWSGEAYLRESSGPLGSYFRGIAGDAVIDDLTLEASRRLEDSPAGLEDAERFPAALARDWDFYRDRVVAYYGLDQPDMDKARTAGDDALLQSKARFVRWVLVGKRVVAVTSPY